MKLIAAALALSLIAGPALAVQPPLAPGKPAGIKKADEETTEAYWMAGILGVTLAVCSYVIFKSNGNGSSTTSTSGTSG
jgi:hypothetical protein